MKNTIFFRFLGCGAILALIAGAVHSQTQIDLRTQAKNVDFSAAPSTKSFQTGTTLPAVCSVGATFFKTNATVGNNFYGCVATNTWAVQSLSPGAKFIVDAADGSLPNAQLGVAGPGISITHSPFTISFNSAALAGVYPSLAGPNVFGPGRNTFQPTSTSEGLRIVAANVPSAPVSGAMFVTLTGQQGHFDGSSVQISTTVSGPGGTAVPTAPTFGNCTSWGNGFTQLDGGGPCAIRVSAPSSSSASCSVGQYAATSTFAYFCVAANTWVRTALSTF